MNQLTSTKVNSTADISWVYDLNGRVITRTSQVGSLSLPLQYGYSNGRLTSVTTPAQQAVTYEYPAGSGGKPRAVRVNGTSILSGASYYPYGPVLTWTWANAQTELRARNGDGLPSAIGGTAGTGITLGYDDALRINNQTVGGNSAASWSYGYDTKDQLTSAVPGAGTALGWTYDLNGNRTSQSGAALSSYGYSTGTNRLSSLDGVSIVTDAVGNITNDGNGTTFVYGPRNRMISSTNAQGTTTYSYNALGERVKKSGPGGTTIFAYDEEGRLIGEYTGAGVMIQEIVWFEGLPVASLRPAAAGGIEIFNISSDHLGTPRVIRRAADGVVVWRWDSDPFGNGSPNENPSGLGTFNFNLRFPGQYADAETGLNYNYFRDYNPKTGRYVQSDPIGLNGGTNTFAYVSNAPLEFSDNYGLAKCIYSISNHTLICDSNNLKYTAKIGPAGIFSGANKDGCRNNPTCINRFRIGPIPVGTYKMEFNPKKFGGAWHLTRGLFELQRYGRSGFYLHLGQGVSEGCITVVEANARAKQQFNNIKRILKNDDENILEVIP